MTNTHDEADATDETPSRKREESNHRRHSDDRAEIPAYVSLDLDGGDVVIYDPDNHRAWIQSDLAVEATAAL